LPRLGDGAWGLARRCSWEVLLAQNGRYELSAAAHARLLEDRFQVVLDGVLGDVQLLGDRVCREAVEYEAAYLLLLFGEAVGAHHDGGDLVGGRLLDDHRDGVMPLVGHP